MPFPFDDAGAVLTPQAILAGVAGVSGGSGVLRVSSLTEVTIALEDSAGSNRVSAFSDAAGQLRVSAIQDSAANLNVSAKSDSATLFRVSAFTGDAANQRVSAVPATQSGAGFKQISSASATNVLTGKGILKNVIFNTSTAARVVLYDSETSGLNIIATLDGAATKYTVVNYDAPVSAGITVSAVSSPGDMTITWLAL